MSMSHIKWIGIINSEIADYQNRWFWRLVFAPTAALRQEGTSYYYLHPSREIELESAPIKAICRVLENAELNYKTCKTWTTDGFYRKTKEMVFFTAAMKITVQAITEVWLWEQKMKCTTLF